MKKKQKKFLNQNCVNCVENESIENAVHVLKKGGVVGFPTETYYGLGVDIRNESAVSFLFSIKKRSLKKPISVLIDSIDQLDSIVSHIPDVYKPLMAKYWPGPLTLIFPASHKVLKLVTGETNKIGVRISSGETAMKLCKQWGKPITATSANISGEKPASTDIEVNQYFGENVDYILPNYTASIGIGSTIIGENRGELVLLREGPIPFKEILRASNSKITD